jgi:hypothetical protein
VYTISAVWALALAYRRVHDKEEEKVGHGDKIFILSLKGKNLNE